MAFEPGEDHGGGRRRDTARVNAFFFFLTLILQYLRNVYLLY